MKRVIIFIVILGIVGTVIFIVYRNVVTPSSVPPLSTQTNEYSIDSAIKSDIWPQNPDIPKNAIVQETTIVVSIVSTQNSIAIDAPYTIIENDGLNRKLVLEKFSVDSYDPVYDLVNNKPVPRKNGEREAQYNIQVKVLELNGELTAAAPRVTVLDGKYFSFSLVNKNIKYGFMVEGFTHLVGKPTFIQPEKVKLHVRMSSWEPNN